MHNKTKITNLIGQVIVLVLGFMYNNQLKTGIGKKVEVDGFIRFH